MSLPTIRAKEGDPAELGWPPTLPMEVAMRSIPLKQLLDDYGLSKQDWDTLRYHPLFIADVSHWMEELKKDDGRFRMKAKLQAEEMLKISWKLVNSGDTPANVRADLIAKTVRWAGLEPRPGGDGGEAGSGFSIVINMG